MSRLNCEGPAPEEIASTAPGMIWRIRSYSPPDKPHFVQAFETAADSKNDEWPPVSCRKFRQYVEGGLAIDKAVADAIRLLLLKMHDAGAILLQQAGEVEEVDPDHANRLGTIIPSDILQLADQLDRDGLRLIEMGYANESLPTRDTGLRVVRASYILQQRQAELATLRGAPVGECPHCGYEGEMVPVTQAGEAE